MPWEKDSRRYTIQVNSYEHFIRSWLTDSNVLSLMVLHGFRLSVCMWTRERKRNSNWFSLCTDVMGLRQNEPHAQIHRYKQSHTHIHTPKERYESNVTLEEWAEAERKRKRHWSREKLITILSCNGNRWLTLPANHWTSHGFSRTLVPLFSLL